MTTPVPPEHRETEDLVRSALRARSRAESAPPPPTLSELRERAARPLPPAAEPDGFRRGARGRPRPLRRALLAAAATVMVVTGVAVALPDDREDRGPTTSTASSAGNVPSVLRRIAAVAATSPPVAAPRPDQFVYTKRVGEAVPRDAPQDYVGPPVPSTLEVWVAQDPRREGLADYDGDRFVTYPAPPDTAEVTYGPTTYAEFAALPTDPVAMRAYLDDLSDGRPFRAAELLLNGNLVPPDVASAIYLALADVPGLTIDPDVVDALGRPGIGLSQTSATGERLQLIFTRDGLVLSGYRSLWTRDEDPDQPGLASRRAGQVTQSYAVVERAVVDEPGQRPR